VVSTLAYLGESQRRLDADLEAYVRQARQLGLSWPQIARAIDLPSGLSAATLRRRFMHVDG
jgi:hypothetical protein